MVKLLGFFILLFFLNPQSLIGIPQILVEASIHENQGTANQKIKGIITITHDRNAIIDPQSFQLNQQPLSVRWMKEVTIPSGEEEILITFYEFDLPPQEKGLHVLSPISVKIGDRTYQSTAISYEVRDIDPSKSAIQQKNQTTIFELQAFVEGPSPLYPGQRAKLVYRILYNRLIDLTNSFLPLLHTEEFKKIGDIQIKDDEKNGVWIQDLWQEIEATKPGSFYYGPSMIEGRAYQVTGLGLKRYDPTPLKAEAPVVEVAVTPLPAISQPASYTGAIGKIDAKLTLLTPKEVQVEETIRLDLAVSGVAQLNELKLPSLQCQPGFSGLFQLSDLPPSSEIKETTKHFMIELRPLSSLISFIPSIELSSFDPLIQNFQIWHSDPIAIKVQAPPIEEKSEEIFSSSSEFSSEKIWETPTMQSTSPALTAIVLTQEDLRSSWLRSPQVLWILPFGLLFLWGWNQRKDFVQKKPTHSLSKSEILLQQSLQNSSQTAISQLEEAILTLLKEQNPTWFEELGIRTLSLKGLENDIQSFLLHLQTIRYSPHSHVINLDRIKEEGRQLFERIKRQRKNSA
jgi:hypothetical protein